MIDLRSDTVTKPTKDMMEAMMNAEVGDDVFGEDPTLNKLQEKAADLFGFEAGLFCPSGTMTNQIAIQVHTKPGDEVICHESAHVYNYEGGGIGRNSFSSVKLIRNSTYQISADEVEALINDDQDWLARTSLVVAEDTSNRGGGKCADFEKLKAVSELCRFRKLGFHMDGARIFNSIVRNGHDLKAYGSLFDSISICLSKGLGTPIGSVLLGSTDFIKEARRARKVMGGGMRQAGILAAAGIYALDNHVDRLTEDHDHAQLLAENLDELKQVTSVIPPETNILIFDVNPEFGAQYFLDKLEEHGLRGVPFGPNRIRLVTHLDASREDILKAKEFLKGVLDRDYSSTV